MTKATSKNRTDNQRSRVAFIAICLAAGLITLTVLVTAFGHVSGHEFSPETLARRSFRYYQVPLIGIQVTPVVREDLEIPMSKYLLVTSAYVQKSSDREEFDLVFRNDEKLGDAKILVDYFNAYDQNGELFWERWSQSHPKHAAVFWPSVIQAARDRMYLALPDVFELVDDEATPDELDLKVRQTLCRSYLRFGQTLANRGNDRNAAGLFQQAAVFDSENSDAQALKLEFQEHLESAD